MLHRFQRAVRLPTRSPQKEVSWQRFLAVAVRISWPSYLGGLKGAFAICCTIALGTAASAWAIAAVLLLEGVSTASAGESGALAA